MTDKSLCNLFDPDFWLASGRDLMRFDLNQLTDDTKFNVLRTLFAEAGRPGLADHLTRYMHKLSEMAEPYVGTLTESDLRDAWEATRIIEQPTH
jgi:hypothetical protein